MSGSHCGKEWGICGITCMVRTVGTEYNCCDETSVSPRTVGYVNFACWDAFVLNNKNLIIIENRRTRSCKQVFLYGNYIINLHILCEYKIFVFMLVRECSENGCHWISLLRSEWHSIDTGLYRGGPWSWQCWYCDSICSWWYDDILVVGLMIKYISARKSCVLHITFIARKHLYRALTL